MTHTCATRIWLEFPVVDRCQKPHSNAKRFAYPVYLLDLQFTPTANVVWEKWQCEHGHVSFKKRCLVGLKQFATVLWLKKCQWLHSSWVILPKSDIIKHISSSYIYICFVCFCQVLVDWLAARWARSGTGTLLLCCMVRQKGGGFEFDGRHCFI